MVEAAIAIPVFILFLGVVIDFGHKMYVRGMLKHAVHVAIDAATKLDLTGCADCSARCLGNTNPQQCNQMCNANYLEYKQRVRSIIRRAEDQLRNSVVHDSGTRVPIFQRLWDPRLQEWVRVLFLRPGEYGCTAVTCQPGERLVHPTRDTPLSTSEEWSRVLAAHPVVAIVRATAPYYLIPVTTSTFEMRAYGFPTGLNLDVFAGGPAATPTPPSGGVTPTPTSTPTPTPTPGSGLPTGTPTPTPTPTPIPPQCVLCLTMPPDYCCRPFRPGCGCTGGGQ